MSQKFTDLFLKSLKPKDKEYTAREKGGFGIRVLPSGRRVFFFLYRVDGQRRFLNLGEYPDGIDLKEARKKYEAAAAQVKLLKDGLPGGADPVQVKVDKSVEREEQRGATTVKMLVEDYLKLYAEKKKKSWLEDKRILEKEILGMVAEGQRQEGAVNWSKRPAADITKRDIVILLNKIVERNAPGTANNTFKIVRTMFNWACEQSILETSPCDRVKMPAPMVVKDRALNADEIKTFWAALADKSISMKPEVRQMLKLVLITAQRPGEIAGMHTSEIDGEWLTIPAERSKNKKSHRVYLTPLARGIIAEAIQRTKRIREIPAEREYSGYIFPCPHHAKDKSIQRHAMSRGLKRNESPDGTTTLGVATFTPHDLRRTAATQMSELKFMDEVIDAILNHTKQGIIATYNKNKYDAEKQQVLEAWERKLISITTGGDSAKVIPIGRKAA